MPTATKPHSQSVIGVLEAGLDGAAFRCAATAPPWAVAEVSRPAAPTPEGRTDKAGLAGHLSMSVRWVEQKMKAGLPHEHIDGRARFRVREAEQWLRDNGHLKAAV